MKTLKIKNRRLQQTRSGIGLDDSKWDRISSKKLHRKASNKALNKKKRKKKKPENDVEVEKKIELEELPEFSYEIDDCVSKIWTNSICVAKNFE